MKMQEGHAVRAGAMYSAAADLVRPGGDDLMAACCTQWDNVTGSACIIRAASAHPVSWNGSQRIATSAQTTQNYSESCSSSAFRAMFWQLHGKHHLEAKYYDGGATYNTVLVGIALMEKVWQTP